MVIVLRVGEGMRMVIVLRVGEGMGMVIVLRVGEGMGMDKCGKIPVLYTARQFLSGFAYKYITFLNCSTRSLNCCLKLVLIQMSLHLLSLLVEAGTV